MFARNGAVLLHVAHDVFAREQEIQLLQALGIAFELVAQKVLHRGSLRLGKGEGFTFVESGKREDRPRSGLALREDGSDQASERR
ncbi:hypothetical protein CTTA_1293 [Comamonas testosteroni]|uniref:Uncharacterized protein n=1 Tax=Comamonas testosteroni TaxID=285 RepID=A0A5A7M8W1_COMTE|nr:hypothetical protein CTTA_1293 [Comamonas testosteroni]